MWYGLRGLQGVGGDEVLGSVMKVFAAWVNERKESYVGGRGHTRGVAIEVEGDDDDAEDKEQLNDKDKDKVKDKAKEPKEKGKDKGQHKDKDKDKDKDKTTRASQSSQSQPQHAEQSQQMVNAQVMADEVVQQCKDSLTQQMSVTLREIASLWQWQKRCLAPPRARQRH